MTRAHACRISIIVVWNDRDRPALRALVKLSGLTARGASLCLELVRIDTRGPAADFLTGFWEKRVNMPLQLSGICSKLINSGAFYSMKGDRYEESCFTVDGGMDVLVGALHCVGVHDCGRAI